ncbi:uncharacterized protein LOC130892246 [Diorhabda carinulata]|uniref:uncharacterized protein LOC130892246 n=1 Tax=Diorhabda carinulata TaxID=1163345 RepID=UPI0025A1162C|nr:uncharacterized protein LOC130892246 [Diorhabda carinulata]
MSYLIRRLCKRTILHLMKDNISIQQLPEITTSQYPNIHFTRYRSKGSKNKIPQRVSESETSDEIKDEDIFNDIKDKHTKTMLVHVPSMRVDTLLKAGLGISRNKLEVMFYESKIRVNGEKIPKKSIGVGEGDEIDVIKGENNNNPDLLTVARIEILSAKGEEESISVKIRRCKSLTIENYEGHNKWSTSQE